MEQMQRVDEMSQETMVQQYLKAHEEYTRLLNEWKELDQSRMRNKEESGHTSDFNETDEGYTHRMAALSKQMEVHQATLAELFTKLSDETKEKYLTVSAVNVVEEEK